LTITGFGFTFTEAETVVRVGYYNLTESEIYVIDANTVMVLSMPSEVLGIPVPIRIQTPVGESNAVPFTYINGVPIQFQRGFLYELYSPTTLTFGPVSSLSHELQLLCDTHPRFLVFLRTENCTLALVTDISRNSN
jgi:hypothetical protein